ncbi:MAG: Hsp20/alpha crystallin family protein [Microscillaceae bacterium]|jgi:HSP20 family protein|nr:Hsp20/alpha crystallin family protein [Microscillaceae bacterium]
MSLLKRNSLANFNPLVNDWLDFNWMSDFFKKEGVPAVNVKETDQNFEIEVAAPGLNKADFKVSLENRVLTISAEKTSEKNEKTEDFTHQEFSFNSFKRSFALPENINEEAIQATYEHGILKLVLGKKEIKTFSHKKEISIA